MHSLYVILYFRKHEKKVSDSRASITMYRTGTVAGKNGPTAFLMKGKRRKAAYTDAFLEKYGCEPGSTIAMTKNAYMTDASWVEITRKIVDGYRAIDIIRDNPQWWMLELFDGFGSHTTNIEAMEVSFCYE